VKPDLVAQESVAVLARSAWSERPPALTFDKWPRHWYAGGQFSRHNGGRSPITSCFDLAIVSFQ